MKHCGVEIDRLGPCARVLEHRGPHLLSPPPTFVGESNPYGGASVMDLWPSPRGSSGDRLCALLRLPVAEYLRRFDRRNLLALQVGERWDSRAARVAAELVGADPRRRLILLGSRVCAAFGAAFEPCAVAWLASGSSALMLPHPSGRSRLWSDPMMPDRAREAFASFCGEQP